MRTILSYLEKVHVHLYLDNTLQASAAHTLHEICLVKLL